MHLILEVLAYADDEANATGRGEHIQASVGSSQIVVAYDGRGTDTRYDEHGATQDVRFFGLSDAPLLPDGLPRLDMSIVACLHQL